MAYKDIEGFEGLYFISPDGEVKNNKSNVLSPGKSSNGYKHVNLHKNGTITTIKIHRLVALHFLPKVYGKSFINHIDGNKHNNVVENLEWCTISENQKHALITGLRMPPSGSKHFKSKKIIDKITGEIFNTIKDASIKTNIPYSTLVYQIRNNISTQFKF